MDLEKQFAQERAEARSVAFTDLDVASDGRSFDGYAAIYGQESDLGEFTEVIVPPAFVGAVERSGNIPMLWDHNAGLPPLATTGGGTLTVREDGRGLRVKASIDERHMLGPTLMSMLERGDVRGMSFGFIAGQGNSSISQRNGKTHRAIRGFKALLDVSPTWNPAYAGTSAELRSLREMALFIDGKQQVPAGEVPQLGDGAPVESHEQEEVTDEVVETESEEQRAGVESAQAEAAARRRRLQMWGMTLPKS
jgi:HK97 family phage prohead protease